MLHAVRGRMEQFFLLVIFFMICTGMLPIMAEAVPPGPTEGIQALNACLLDAMKRADELGYAGRYKLLEPVLKDTFDFSFMGAKSIGRFWETLNAEQQALFMKTYTDWSIATYAGRFDGYSGERFELVSDTAHNARLHVEIIGDGERRNYLETLKTKLGLSNVKFCGRISNSEVRRK